MYIIALAIIVATIINAYSKSTYHVKPRLAFAQVTVLGQTENSETMQITATLWKDETAAQHNATVTHLCEIREARLAFQNQRMVDLQAQVQKDVEDSKLKVSKING